MQQTAKQFEAIGNGTYKVTGALTFATVTTWWQLSQAVLLQTAAAKIAINLQAVTQSDSAGVALLLAWLRLARTRKMDLIFLELPEQMRAIARVSDLEKLLPTAARI